MFRTIWRALARKADSECLPGEAMGTRPDTRFIEIGMKLRVDADGHVIEAIPLGEARDVAEDGNNRKPKLGAAQPVFECYAKQIKALVTFPPATSPSQLTVQVRTLDRGAPP